MTGTERKAINRYYPPDFDPRKIPKGKFDPNRQFVQRIMAPFNMRCDTCGEYIYKGKKFNARRETVQDDSYISLALFRFYIRCPGCLAEISFKTDLKNCDYTQEHGSTRLFEAERLYRQEQEKEALLEEEDKTNPMKMLEKRTKMSRIEMEALERLEELKEMNVRQAKPNFDEILDDVTKEHRLALKRQEDEDEAFVNGLFSTASDGKRVKRILESDDDDIYSMAPVCSKSAKTCLSENLDLHAKTKKKAFDQKSLLTGVLVKKSPKIEIKSEPMTPDVDHLKKSTNEAEKTPNALSLPNGLLSLAAYSSSSSDSD